MKGSFIVRNGPNETNCSLAQKVLKNHHKEIQINTFCINKILCKISSSHSGVSEDLSLLGYDAVLVAKQLYTASIGEQSQTID